MQLADYFEARGIPRQDAGEGRLIPALFTGMAHEYRATRRRAGLFDFSFMLHLEISGHGALRWLDAVQTRPAAALQVGQIAYTLLLRHDGSVFNDATVWRLAADRFWLFTGRPSDLGHLLTVTAGEDLRIKILTDRCAVLAVQGPMSLALLEAAGAPPDLAGLRYFRHRPLRLAGYPVRVGRIGYTGEAGYEILVDQANAVALWEILVAAGTPFGVAECGFAAADMLRIEAGYLLFSRELAHRLCPQELNLQHLVAPRHRTAPGGQALRRPPHWALVGLLLDRHRPPAAAGWRKAGNAGCGILTSTCQSPALNRPIGLGLVPRSSAYPGQRLVLAGGEAAMVCRLPFYDPGRRLPRRQPYSLHREPGDG